MGTAYSIDLRERVVQLKLTGQYTNQEIADIFLIGVTSVKDYYRKHKNNESLEPKQPPGRPPKINDDDKLRLRKHVEANPDATLEEYRDYLGLETGKLVTIPCIHYILKSMGISFKKKPLRSGTRER